jgi:predicted nucleic acid-binding protein
MRDVLVDTNVLVSFLTTRNAKQQQLAADLFRAAAERKLRLVVHGLAMSEAVCDCAAGGIANDAQTAGPARRRQRR